MSNDTVNALKMILKGGFKSPLLLLELQVFLSTFLKKEVNHCPDN